MVKPVFEDTKQRQVKGRETVSFFVNEPSIYLVEVKARTRGKKQVGGSDDEDLKVEIDGLKFPSLSGQSRYFDSPAAFPGGKLHGLSKSIFFFLPLTNGLHEILLISNVSASLEAVQVFQINIDEEVFISDIVVEDGDRRPWLTFVFSDVLLKEFSLDLILRRRFMDSDDIKVIVDDIVKRNHRSILHKLWYLIATFNEVQSGNFETNFTSGLHYVEIWADRLPVLDRITFMGLASNPIRPKAPVEIIKDKIRLKAREYGFDEEMMLRLVKKESQFNPKAVSPREARGLFQLTSDTVKQINYLGYLVSDPFDIDQNIKGGFIYFHRLHKRYEGQEDWLVKTLAAWNWGLSNLSVEGKLEWGILPDGTKKFIEFVLGK